MTRKGLTRTREKARSHDFQQQAEQAAPGLLSEFIDFVLHNKKWWMIPIVVSLLILGLVAWLASSAGGVAPFIYTLF
jgi:hypothetical protein